MTFGLAPYRIERREYGTDTWELQALAWTIQHAHRIGYDTYESKGGHVRIVSQETVWELS